ncbi:hypothetical protein [Capillimicrobium parvum]|uniref:CARDB domain-containing protein n=1 Tax=Capillimicrobium parvum TaxID=2884022 RepID=A0A9E7C1T2_9ACTN|nr:hypothetical protein [Capillimicrobium parvum]UGS37726.1 hypothetical protein DSM104329_04147 [Capillimicrobium parvum]
MRKLAILSVALVAVLGTAAVAVAQSGSYGVTASTSPAKPGSLKKPLAISVKFGVQWNGGGRAFSTEGFKVAFAGVRTNGKRFKTCTAAKINAAQSDRGCSRAALVGTGTVHNLAGNAADINDTSITCDLNVKIYNAGNKRAAIFLAGNPPQCVIPISQALDARWVRAGSGEALQFSIPSNLRHPVTGVDNSIISLNATINRKTTGRGKKKVAYMESIGCNGNKRGITLTLTPESGAQTSTQASANC